MRFPTLVFTVGLLAAGSSSHAHKLDARTFSDVCAYIDSDLSVTGTHFGHLSVCLCLSGVSALLTSHPAAKNACSQKGTSSVSAIVTALINNAASHSKCSYPDHCTPACVNDSPCGFNCNAGFTAHPVNNPTECLCQYPNTNCNGVCGSFPHGCSTSAPRQRSLEGSGMCAEKGLGWEACGVYGGAARAWECVDTQNDLESCGGCALPLTPYSAVGTDCSALPGVADVSCFQGGCLVSSCLDGFELNDTASACIEAEVDGELKRSEEVVRHVSRKAKALKH